MTGRTLALTGAVVFVAAAVPIAWPHGGGSSPVRFSTIPAAKLAMTGITLSAPIGPVPSADSGVVMANAVSEENGGRKVLEYHYAHCALRRRDPGRDCWAVSLDPTGITSNPPPGKPLERATYFLALIDPTTDKLIEGAQGG